MRALLHAKHFSTSALARANRAIVYPERGKPASVLKALTYPSLPPPAANTLNIRYLLSPVNPADINVIEGQYPARPERRSDLNSEGWGSEGKGVYVAGNEGLAEVKDVGAGVTGLKKGDWVVMVKPQAGTWGTAGNVGEEDVVKVPADQGKLSEAHAATMTVRGSSRQ